MPPEEKTQTQTQTEEPQDLSDMLVDDAEIEAAEEAAEAQSQQTTDNAQSSEAEPSDSAQTSEAASTAGEGDKPSGPPLPDSPPSQDSPSTATSEKTEVQTQTADAGAQQTTDTAPPPDQSQVQPQSAEAILQSMGLLPEGFEVPKGAEGEQQTQTQVQTQPEQPPVVQTQPVQTQQQQPPEQTQTQPEQTQTQPTLEQVRNQQIEELARTQYALDKDTVEVLEAEGSSQLAEIIPTMASRVFIDAVQATMANLAQMLPGILDQRETQRAESAKYEEAFYSFWDSRGFDLREHEGDLRSIGQAYNSVNPTRKADEFITNVGAQLIIAKQLTPKEQKGGSQSGQQQQPTNGNVEQAQPQTQQPFQSAGTTGAPHTLPPQRTAFQEFFEQVESADFDE